MAGVAVEGSNASVSEEMKTLQAENAQLKIAMLQLEQRVERLEKRLEEALETKRTSLEARSFNSQSRPSSTVSLLHPSSPLLASAVLKSGEAEVAEVDVKKVEQLLRHVAYGEQEEAEALVQKQPQLLLSKGGVRDLSEREFKEISAFQYALWALDWHMWRMLLKYMDKEAAALQLAELEEKETVHGKHFSLEPLIEALKSYGRSYSSWEWGEQTQQWCQMIGRNQRLLPVHVLNEYCHPTRPLYPYPTFCEETLVRSMELYGIHQGDKLYRVQGNCFTSEVYGGKLGATFAIARCNVASATAYCNAAISEEYDAAALQCLWTVRQHQLETLKGELFYSPAVIPHLPPALTRMVVDYLVADSVRISISKG